MLARLAKMRIVGLKYDSTTINTENLILDFTIPEGEPGHAAYILRNAGGKGVFLQSLIQTMEPGADWKEGKNKVTQFFYNEEKKPINYTFHVVQEWFLSPMKSVVLGVSIAPKFSSFGSRTSGETALAIDYVTYVKEFTPNERFDLFSDLKLWKEEEKEAVNLDTIKEMLKADSTFTIFPMNNVEEYKEKISEFGVTDASVSIIKQINVSEGDFGKFFEGATDNLGLFYKLLIPTINDKLEGIDSRNKQEDSSISLSFLDTLKISKELPDLLAMVDSIEQINDIILPLKERFLEGEEIQTKLEKCEGKGLEILQFLETLGHKKVNDYNNKEKDKSSKDQELNFVQWKFRNIDYIELVQERDDLDGEYYEKEHEQKNKDLFLKNVRKELTEAKVNLEIKKREGLLEEIDKKNYNISILLQSENAQTTLKTIDEVKAYFQERWDDIYSYWQHEMNKYSRSMYAHNNKLAELADCITAEDKQCIDIGYDIRDIEKNMQEHEKKMLEANERYGVEVRYLIKDLLHNAQKEQELIMSSIQQEEQQLSEVEDKILELNVQIGKIETEVKNVVDKIKEANEKMNETSIQEKEVISQASHILKHKFVGELERNTAIEVKSKLIKHLQGLKAKEKQELLSKWEVDEDMYLIEEGNELGCFIPNKDLLKVKSLLDENKVSSLFGAQFLSKLTPEERKIELEQNPAIRYSIVVLEDKFESLNLSFIEEELIRSNVLLVDRTQTSKKTRHRTTNPSISKLDEVNYLLNDKSYVFIEDEYELEVWKAGIEKKADDIEIELDSTQKNIREVEVIIRKIEGLLKSTLKVEWANVILKLESQNKHLLTDITTFQSNLNNKENEKKHLKDELVVKYDELTDCKQREKELIQLEIEIEQNKRNVHQKKMLLEKLSYQQHLLDELKKDEEQFRVQKLNNENSYNSWNKFVKDNYSVLKRLLGDEIELPVPVEISCQIEENDLKPQTFRHTLKKEEFNRLLAYKELESDLSNRNSRIADERAEIKVLNEKLTEVEVLLQQLYGNGWKNIEVPEDDILHLKNNVTVLEKAEKKTLSELETIKNDMSHNKRQMDALEKKIEAKKKELERDFPEGAQYEAISDCNELREIYRQKSNVLNKEINEINLKISSLKRIIEDINRTGSLIRGLGLNSKNQPNQLSDEEKLELGSKPMEYYSLWNAEYNRILNGSREFNDVLRTRVNQMKDKIESFQHLPEKYKFELLNFLSTIREISYQEAITCLNNYLDWAKDNLQDEMAQKEKADMAINLWVERSSRRVLQVVGALQHLANKMTIINWKEERFPLIKYSKNFPFPTELEDVQAKVKEFCLNEIDRYVKKTNKNVEELTVKDIARTVNVSNLTLQALGDFPRLLIHIPGIEGDLLRGETKYAKYEEWEVINNGSASSATKSGGQTLMARMIVIAMLMRERVDDNSPLFLVTDNPFGTMSAKELIESTFSLLDLLRIQWLVVAPPIANVHITSKFHTVYNMSIEVMEGTKVLSKKLMKNHRRFLQNISVLDNPEEKKA